jgi:hypothetical protein
MPRLEGYALDYAREQWQMSTAAGFRQDEVARQEALRFQLAGYDQDELARQRAWGFQLAGDPGYDYGELARQRMLSIDLAGFRQDEVARQEALRFQLAGANDQKEIWLAVIDHLNNALPYVSNIVGNIVGARERIDAMKLEIRRMESANQHDLVVMEAKNYWLARMAKEQGFQMDPGVYQNALLWGDALKQMGPQGQAYLNQGYNQAFEMGAEFGVGGEMRDGYLRLQRDDWARMQAGKNLPWWILGIVGGTVILIGGIVVTVVVVTR